MAAQSGSPTVVNETVLAAKEFLDGEFRKTATIADLPANLIDLLDSKTNEQALSALKTKGVGQTTILKFLGGKGISGRGIGEV